LIKVDLSIQTKQTPCQNRKTTNISPIRRTKQHRTNTTISQNSVKIAHGYLYLFSKGMHFAYL